MTIALPFDGAVVDGRESLVFTIQIRRPQHTPYSTLTGEAFSSAIFGYKTDAINRHSEHQLVIIITIREPH